MTKSARSAAVAGRSHVIHFGCVLQQTNLVEIQYDNITKPSTQSTRTERSCWFLRRANCKGTLHTCRRHASAQPAKVAMTLSAERLTVQVQHDVKKRGQTTANQCLQPRQPIRTKAPTNITTAHFQARQCDRGRVGASDKWYSRAGANVLPRLDHWEVVIEHKVSSHAVH